MASKKFDVRVYPLDDPQGSTMAFASAALNVDGQDVAAIRGIRIVDGPKGMFVSMPQFRKEKEDGETKYFNVVNIKSGALLKDFNNAVLAEYAKAQSPEYKQSLTARDEAKQAQMGETPQDGGNISVSVFTTPLDDPQGSTKAFASVLFKAGDEKLIDINSVRVVEGKNGLFVSMPKSKTEKGGSTEFHDIAFPLTKALHSKASSAVLAEYSRSLSAERKPRIGDMINEGKEQSAQRAANAPARQPASKTAGLGD